MKAQVGTGPAVVMTEDETRRAVARDDRAMGLRSWKAMSRIVGLGKEHRMCGVPLGGVHRRYEPRKGVWNAAHLGVSSCNDSWCPRCGLEIALRRWAILVLAGAGWVRDGGFLVFVSIAGQHDRSEPFQAKYERWRWISEWVPGKGAGPGRLFLQANGAEAFVKITEATVGGRHGANVGGHLVLFCKLPEDSEDRPEWVAEDMGRRLQQALGDHVMHRALRYGEQAPADNYAYFMSSVAFHSRLAGVSEVAEYATKLADGPGLGGAASEMTDPTGTKVGARNISMRGLALHVGRETLRMGYKQPTAAIRHDERLRGLVDQYAAVRAAMRGAHRNQWSATRGLFARWSELDTPTLIGMAMEVIAEDDPATSERVAVLLDVVTAPIGHEEAGPLADGPAETDTSESASRAFHRGAVEVAPIDHDDPDYFVTVLAEERVTQEWVEGLDDSQRRDIDIEMVRTLDREGPWRTALALRAAVVHATGEQVQVYRRGGVDGDRPEILVTTEYDTPPGWEHVAWSDVTALAGHVPRRHRSPIRNPRSSSPGVTTRRAS